MPSTPADPALTDAVALLVERHFPAELADAVLNDDDVDFAVLVDACSGISGGDVASIGLVFGEVADRDADLGPILDTDPPSAALAALVAAHHKAMRAS